MATVLIADDTPLDRRLASRLLEEIGWTVLCAEDGQQALEQVATNEPDIVLTDMQMPKMDGLELVKELAATHPAIPVILMTAYGSQELAVRALQEGAASYVPKERLARDLTSTAKSVLAIAQAKRESEALIDSMRQVESEYVLPNAVDSLDTLIGHIKDQLISLGLFGQADVLRVGTALYEALINAIEHGNLELRSETRDQPSNSYRLLMEERAAMPRFQKRHVYLTTKMSHSEAVFVVRDEGHGFDPTTLPDPTDPDNVGKVNGRGLFLIQTFMDEIRFNDPGNELTMIKRRSEL
jgi:CheY-like chemotaxis protein